MDEKAQKNLRLVTFWLFGSVMIVSAGVVAYVSFWILPLMQLMPGQSPVGYILSASWPIILIAAVAAVVLWAGYRYWYLPRMAK